MLDDQKKLQMCEVKFRIPDGSRSDVHDLSGEARSIQRPNAWRSKPVTRLDNGSGIAA
jgi:hypothetical protein